MNLFQAWEFAAIDFALYFVYVFFEAAVIKLGLKNPLGLFAIKTKNSSSIWTAFKIIKLSIKRKPYYQ